MKGKLVKFNCNEGEYFTFSNMKSFTLPKMFTVTLSVKTGNEIVFTPIITAVVTELLINDRIKIKISIQNSFLGYFSSY